MHTEPFTSAKNLLLTTFRKDGTPVATPVWFASMTASCTPRRWRVRQAQAHPQQPPGHRRGVHRERNADRSDVQRPRTCPPPDASRLR